MQDKTKMQRLLQLILLLQDGRYLLHDLSYKLAVNKRTVQRYLVDLEEVGVPWYRDSHYGFYRLADKAVLKPMVFSVEEVIAMLHYIDAFGQSENPFFLPLQQAREKIMATLTLEKKPLAEKASQIVSIGNCASMREINREIFYQVEEAITKQRVLTIFYHSASREQADWREIEPYFIHYREGCWYVVAWCRRNQAERTFRLDRIHELQLLDEVFTEKNTVCAKEYFSNSLGIGKGDITTVVLRFSKARSRWFRDQVLHASQKQRELVDGRLEIELKVCYNWELLRMVLGFGSDIEVIEPQRLREDVKEEAQRMLR